MSLHFPHLQTILLSEFHGGFIARHILSENFRRQYNTRHLIRRTVIVERQREPHLIFRIAYQLRLYVPYALPYILDNITARGIRYPKRLHSYDTSFISRTLYVRSHADIL